MEAMREQGHSDWQMEDEVLTGQGKDGLAETRAEFSSPFELQVWVKTMVNGNGGVLFNGGPGRVEVQCFNAPDSTNPGKLTRSPQQSACSVVIRSGSCCISSTADALPRCL